MRRHIFRCAVLSVVIPMLGALMSGCSSTALRGTPYYTTEYEPARGPASDRISLRPIVYYRYPTLSVLWPLFEKSNEYLALRPLLSVYGLNEPKRVYSLLWPFGQFDRIEEENRFFPFFWGTGYAVAFPLYWHFDHPLGSGGGTDALIPLWYYSSDPQGYSANVLWPFFQVKNRTESKGWRVWPLVGSYAGPENDAYRFLLWPLGHQWSRGPGRARGDAFLPLYARETAPGEDWFLSLPYSWHRDREKAWLLILPLAFHSRDGAGTRTITPLYSQGESRDGRKAWRLLLPLCFSARTGDRHTLVSLLGGLSRDTEGTGWLVVPLLSGGVHTRERNEAWFVGPMAHFNRDAEGASSYVLPLYYAGSNTNGRTFISIPWSSGAYTNGDYWQLIPPLMLRTGTAADRRLFTPLYSAGTSGAGAANWQLLFPLWYRSDGPAGKLLATLIGGRQTSPDGHIWLIWPLLSRGKSGPDSRDLWIVAPIFHARWDRDGVSHHLLPLYWWNAPERTLVSPAVVRWGNRAAREQSTLVPPALTLYSSSPETRNLWTAAGLAHFSWGAKPGSSHVLPFYYYNGHSGTFVSMPWIRWTGRSGSTNLMMPPALSWLTRTPERSDLWMVGPLAHVSWGANAGPSHVLPLFYRNKTAGTFVSLPYAQWKTGTAERKLIPPLLSMYSRDGSRKRLDALLGIFSESWGDATHEGHLLPLYYHDQWTRFFTLLFGWDRDPDDGFYYPLTPLLGVRTGRHAGGWLMPLWSRDRDLVAGTTSGTVLWGTYRSDGRRTDSALFPLFGYKNRGPIDTVPPTNSWRETYGKTFWCLPTCWYRNTADITPALDDKGRRTGQMQTRLARDNGVFPLWTYTHLTSEQGERVYGSLLLLLYDHKRTVTPGAPGRPPEEYIRKRLLWWVYHYELDHGDVSVDIFPTITYDRTHDGTRKWAFLWRAFRYESGPAGKKLDLLFIPLVRQS